MQRPVRSVRNSSQPEYCMYIASGLDDVGTKLRRERSRRRRDEDAVAFYNGCRWTRVVNFFLLKVKFYLFAVVLAYEFWASW